MALPRKLTTQIPGEPEPSTPEPEPSTPEAGLLTTPEVAYVVDRRPGELPDASEIDARAITKPVLTAQGYVVPEVS